MCKAQEKAVRAVGRATSVTLHLTYLTASMFSGRKIKFLHSAFRVRVIVFPATQAVLCPHKWNGGREWAKRSAFSPFIGQHIEPQPLVAIGGCLYK